MSCYILPAGQSTFVNFAALYQTPILFRGSLPLTWSPTTHACGGIELPPAASTRLGTSCSGGGDPLSTALVTPELASSFVYQSLCGAGARRATIDTNSLPVVTPSSSAASFCCVGAPFSNPSAVAAANFPYSVDQFPEVGGAAAPIYNCTGMSTFQLVSNNKPHHLSTSSGSPGSILAAQPTCWRREQSMSLSTATGSPQEFYRLRRLLRRVQRRSLTSSSPEVGKVVALNEEEQSGRCGSVGGEYPLFCVVCRVKLNATTQARQHYTGRSHARRVRLLYGPDAVTAAGTAADPALGSTIETSPSTSLGVPVHNFEDNSTANSARSSSGSRSPTGIDDITDDAKRQSAIVTSSSGTSSRRPLFPVGTVTPVSCDVYCSACAVSFNSTIQARQHYHGKSHAKRLRTVAPDLAPARLHPSPPGDATVHKNAIYTCLVCNARPENGAHHSRVTSSKPHHQSALGASRNASKHSASSASINKRRPHRRLLALRYQNKQLL